MARARGVLPLVDGAHDKALADMHIARGKYAAPHRHKIVGHDASTRFLGEAIGLNERFFRAGKAHGDQHQVSRSPF